MLVRLVKQDRQSQESGAIMVLLALAISAIAGVAAFALENSREALAAQYLQGASDAAALAGARYLDGTEAGWLNSKRVALTLLHNSSIFGAEEKLSELHFSSGSSDPLESDPLLKFSEGRVGNVWLKFERGLYRSVTDERGKSVSEFVSLETTSPEQAANPNMLAANAIRVNLSLKPFATPLAKVLSMGSVEGMERTSVALSESIREECVAPIAIPACALMLDTRRASAMKYETNSYDPIMQCQREVVVTEADMENAARADGIARSESYPRRPYFNPSELSADEPPKLNTKAIPIRAVLGVPDNGLTGSSKASPREVSDYIRQLAGSGPENCPMKVRIGARFKPLDSLFKREGGTVVSDPGTFEFLDNREVEEKLAYLINDPEQKLGNRSFAEVFGETTNPNNPPKPNYPFLRNIRPDHPDPWVELRLTWPLSTADDSVGSMNMSPMAGPTGGDWVNPMCHSELVANPNDPQKARVKEVTVMVVAPTTDDNYCDLSSLFNGSEQNAFPPLSATAPTVVGFTKAYLYDFNINNLDRQFAWSGGTPIYVNEESGQEIIDRNPFSTRDSRGADKSFVKVNYNPVAISRYEKQFEAWESCVESKAQKKWKQYCGQLSPDDAQGLDCCECLANPADRDETWASCSAQCSRFPEAVGCGQQPVDPRIFASGNNPVVDNQSEDFLECTRSRSCKSLPTMLQRTECRKECREEARADARIEAEEEKLNKRWWSGSCFRMLDGQKSPLEGSVGEIHPLLIQDAAVPGYIDRRHFWVDPERYYAELEFVADVLGVSGFVENDPEYQLHFPSYQELRESADPERTFEQAIELLVQELHKPSYLGKRKPKLEAWDGLFEIWLRQARDASAYSKPERRLDSQDFPANISSGLSRLIQFFGPGPAVFGVTESQVFPVVEGFPAEFGYSFAKSNFDSSRVKSVLKKLYDPLEYLQRRTGISIPGQHCLPLKKDNEFPTRDPSKWEQPRSRKAQYGCGGLRIRLSCDAGQTSITNTPSSDRLPTLVE